MCYLKKDIKLNHKVRMSALAKNYNRRKIAFKKVRVAFYILQVVKNI